MKVGKWRENRKAAPHAQDPSGLNPHGALGKQPAPAAETGPTETQPASAAAGKSGKGSAEADAARQPDAPRRPPRFIDISPPISDRLQVWPGDVPFRLAKSSTFDAGHLDLGDVHTSLHIGAHTDAPMHYARGGADIASLPLEPYYGACQVVDVRATRGKRFGIDDLMQTPTAPRLLLKTGTFPDAHSWNRDFAAPEPSLVDDLAARGVVLLGLDTPSTDPFDSKGLPSHQRLLVHGMMNLEGLILDHVEPGHYTLIALPLRIEGADASPVRAVLVA